MSGNSTRSDIELQTVYGPGDSAGRDSSGGDSSGSDSPDREYAEQLGDPGEYPFTRGTRAYTGQGWIQRELSGEGDAKRSNEQFKYLMDLGQTGLDVIGDSPTMSLMDPDHPLARYTVGTQGVSLCSHEDYRQLLEDIPLDQMSISSSSPSMFMVASLYMLAEERGTSPASLRGSVIEWPFYSEHCSYAYKMPFDLHLRMSCDVIEFCSREMPRFHGFLEDTYFFSEAGLNAVEEAALGFVEIRHIVRTLLERGLDIDSFAPRIAILTNCSMDFYEEIAKIRAMRRIFARMMKEEFGAQDPRSQAVNVAVHTSGLSLTTEQPANNIVRGAVQTVALGLAGVSALEISTFDEGYRTPSKEAHLVGLRTQQVIDVETNINSVQDPFGGSWFMESLTDEVEAKILAMVDDIESRGDPAELVNSGFFRQFFHGTMSRYHDQVHDGDVLKVGMNLHQMAPEDDTLLRDISEEKIEPLFDRIDELQKFRAGRDQERLQAAFRRLHDVVQSDENMLEAVIECTAAGATMGEVAGIMRQAWGVPYDPYGYLESPLGGAQ